jgi:ABC-2 type transport system permease protein
MILAVLRAQWLSMRSFQIDSRRRGAIFSVVTGIIWYGFWTFLAQAAQVFVTSAESVSSLAGALPAALMFVFLYWQLAPLVSASLGASLDLKKLLVYPIPHGKLFVVEVLLRITTCAEMVLFLSGVVIGLFRNPLFGGMRAAPRVLVPFVIFILFNLLLAAGSRSLLEQLLTHKRLREITMLLVVLGASIPQVLITTGSTPAPLKQWINGAPWWFWPWSAVATSALGGDFLMSLAILAIWTGAAWRFGRWQFERGLNFDAQASGGATASRPERSRPWLEAFYRSPSLLLPDPLAVIVEKELRTLSRTARFRMVFIMGFTFGLLVWLPLLLGRNPKSRNVVSEHYLTLVSVYALTLLGQVSYLNSFGFDRSAAQVYYCLPVSIGRALAGKNLAAGLFILVELLLVSAVCVAFRLPVSAEKIIEAFVVTCIVGLYLVGLGNLSSVHFPRAMNPERVSQGGSGSRMQAVIFLLFPVALLPVFLAYWARYVFHSGLIFSMLLGVAAVVGIIFYWIAMDSAVSAAIRRRELILTELARGEGPVVTG